MAKIKVVVTSEMKVEVFKGEELVFSDKGAVEVEEKRNHHQINETIWVQKNRSLWIARRGSWDFSIDKGRLYVSRYPHQEYLLSDEKVGLRKGRQLCEKIIEFWEFRTPTKSAFMYRFRQWHPESEGTDA